MKAEPRATGRAGERDDALAGIVIALGALMFLGGAGCIALGAPYLVLERGFTLAIIGSVLACAGLVVIVQGLVLRELRRKATRLAMPPLAEATEPASPGRVPPAQVQSRQARSELAL